MRLTINSELREVEGVRTVAELLALLALPSTRVAVEVNGQLVRRVQHAEHLLRPDDRLEIVTLVGGG